MKFVPALLASVVEGATVRRNIRVLLRFLAVLLGLITLYSVLFHVLMAREGQDHSWVTGVYWTLTVMSTLGFGDITFQSDLGRVFSIVVLLSGVLFLLIVLPFTFIQFFYAPWLEAQTRRRVPRDVRGDVREHVILTAFDPVASALARRLTEHSRPWFLLEGDLQRALELEQQGVSVILGEMDDPETYGRLRLETAGMVVATADDFTNTNIVLTVREVDGRVPVTAFVRSPASVDVLQLAGASHVLQLTEMLGRSLARRVVGGLGGANVLGSFGELLIAEAPVTGTPMIGRRLGEGWLRRETGLTVVGAWERGHFRTPGRETTIQPSTVLVLAGTREQLTRFDEFTAIYTSSAAPVPILGGGRVGRAVAAALSEREIPCRIVEKNPDRVRLPEITIEGDAADLEVLERAGIREAPSALVTTADDATNIFLTNYVRKLRPDIQLISRATLERNVTTLHRAGADFVMSYASMGANAVLNLLEGGDIIMVAEGLDVFRSPVPRELRGVPLAESGIRESTGCSVVAFEVGEEVRVNPPASAPLPAADGAELILIATTENERRFAEHYESG
ncbi:MAG: NAD-binding protein [Gemmatimonadota bacterium]